MKCVALTKSVIIDVNRTLIPFKLKIEMNYSRILTTGRPLVCIIWLTVTVRKKKNIYIYIYIYERCKFNSIAK